MKKPAIATIEVKGTAVSILTGKEGDFISLTDMLKAKDGEFFISDWLRNRNTVEFLGIWESVFNPDFNYGEFATIRSQAGLNSYKISVKEWVQKTNAIGLKATAGRYGGTFAHPDIAFEFGMWISPEFKIYVVREFRRLKDEENDRLKLDWETSSFQLFSFQYFSFFPIPASALYASEADLRNVALFGQTAKQWREANPAAEGNVRDHAPLEQLVVLTNLESLNSVLSMESESTVQSPLLFLPLNFSVSVFRISAFTSCPSTIRITQIRKIAVASRRNVENVAMRQLTRNKLLTPKN